MFSSTWGVGRVFIRLALVSLGFNGHQGSVQDLYLPDLEKIFCAAYPEIPEEGVFQQKNLEPRIKADDVISVFSQFIKKFDEQVISCKHEERLFDEYPDREAVGYMEKFTMPSGSVILQIGDLHGSLFTLLRILRRLVIMGYLRENFQINPSKPCHIMFLGDYGDRVPYGVEVLFIALYLKLMNWKNVTLLRGNHELISMNAFPQKHGGGLLDEIDDKYPAEANIIKRFLGCCYDKFLLSSYVQSGNARVMFCHGGIELGYEPKNFLLDPTSRMQKITHDHLSEKDIEKSGFLWSDFVNLHNHRRKYVVNNNLATEEMIQNFFETRVSMEAFEVSGRGKDGDLFVFDRYYTQNFCDKNSLSAVVRGHQDFEGVCCLLSRKLTALRSIPQDWKKIVATRDEQQTRQFLMHRYGPVFTIATPSTCKLDTLEGFTTIETGDEYSNWIMTVYEYPLASLEDRLQRFCRWTSLDNSRSDILDISWH